MQSWQPVGLSNVCPIFESSPCNPFEDRSHVDFIYPMVPELQLTHWGRVTHICVSKLTIIGSDNGLSPDRRQAIIWTNTGLLLIGPLGTNFSEILIEILTFSFKKMLLKVSSAKRRPFCLGPIGLDFMTGDPDSSPSNDHQETCYIMIKTSQTISSRAFSLTHWLLGHVVVTLTHLPPDKMTTISQTIYSDVFSFLFCILINISLKFVRNGLIDNYPALV